MEETNHNPVKQRCLDPHKIAKLLLNTETQKEALASQVEKLKGQLQSAKTHSADQEEKAKELAAKLEDRNSEIQSLRQQVKKMDMALQSASVMLNLSMGRNISRYYKK